MNREWGFLNLLNATDIGEAGGRYVKRLNEPLVFILPGDRMIVIPRGFETDLASVPRLPIIYGIWGDRAHREAVLHDYAYRRDAKIVERRSNVQIDKDVTSPIARPAADWYFRMAMKSRARSWWIYQPMYWAVRCGGAESYHRMAVADHFPLTCKED